MPTPANSKPSGKSAPTKPAEAWKPGRTPIRPAVPPAPAKAEAKPEEIKVETVSDPPPVTKPIRDPKQVERDRKWVADFNRRIGKEGVSAVSGSSGSSFSSISDSILGLLHDKKILGFIVGGIVILIVIIVYLVHIR